MSRVARPNGEDHAEAAKRHLDDAAALLREGRPDGAAYVSGYVVECALKTVCLFETQGSAQPLKWSGTRGHDLPFLSSQLASLASVAGARAAKYWGPAVRTLAQAGIWSWAPEMRYRGSQIDPALAQQWYEEATAVYTETVAAMFLDGVI